MTQWRTSSKSARYIRLTAGIVGMFGGKMGCLQVLDKLELEIYQAAWAKEQNLSFWR